MEVHRRCHPVGASQMPARELSVGMQGSQHVDGSLALETRCLGKQVF